MQLYDLRASTLPVQAGSELTTFAWDTTSQIFVESKAEDPYLIAFLALAQLCRIASVMPVAQCLPAAASTRSQKVQLQLQLTVPSRSRLLGWQPAGSAVSAEAEALSLISDKPQMDVAVLVRHPSGPYMPVTLELLSQNANSPAGTRSARVKVRHAAREYCRVAVFCTTTWPAPQQDCYACLSAYA